MLLHCVVILERIVKVIVLDYRQFLFSCADSQSDLCVWHIGPFLVLYIIMENFTKRKDQTCRFGLCVWKNFPTFCIASSKWSIRTNIVA